MLLSILLSFHLHAIVDSPKDGLIEQNLRQAHYDAIYILEKAQANDHENRYYPIYKDYFKDIYDMLIDRLENIKYIYPKRGRALKSCFEKGRLTAAAHVYAYTKSYQINKILSNQQNPNE